MEGECVGRKSFAEPRVRYRMTMLVELSRAGLEGLIILLFLISICAAGCQQDSADDQCTSDEKRFHDRPEHLTLLSRESVPM